MFGTKATTIVWFAARSQSQWRPKMPTKAVCPDTLTLIEIGSSLYKDERGSLTRHKFDALRVGDYILIEMLCVLVRGVQIRCAHDRAESQRTNKMLPPSTTRRNSSKVLVLSDTFVAPFKLEECKS